MIVRYQLLSARIRQELDLLDEVIRRCEAAVERFEQNPRDRDFYLGSAALDLHDFYVGLERIFTMIADEVDEARPEGASWHRELLTQMKIELPGVRPPVVSAETASQLDAYLRFRHVVRRVYTFNLDAERVKRLVKGLRPVYERAAAELRSFAEFLEALSRADEEV